MDELIHEDTFKLLDKELPFHQYTFPIEIEFDGGKYICNTCLPTVGENNLMLNMLSIDVLQNNLEKTGDIFTKYQKMTLLTKSIDLVINGQEPVSTSNKQEISITYQSYIPFTGAEKFFDQYGKEFDSYVPKFYKEVKCPLCGHDLTINIDLEVELFQRSIFGRESSE